MRAGAIIFDMDGVLVDSEPLHHRTLNEVLAEEGCSGLDFAQYVPYMGTTDEYTWSDLIRRLHLPNACEYYCDRYDERILLAYRRFSTPAAGAVRALSSFRALGLPMAVASSSRREWVETCLAAMNVRHYFDVVVSGEMATRSKPDPEIYLLAAQRLGVPPRACIAVEDAPQGVAAALAASMFTVAVASPYPTAGDTEGAHLHVRSLEELDAVSLVAHAGREYQQSEA
jgi:beta-phosphoglucomutase-like phosphatase (HAD superfamily)